MLGYVFVTILKLIVLVLMVSATLLVLWYPFIALVAIMMRSLKKRNR